MDRNNINVMEHPFTEQQMRKAVDRDEPYMEGIVVVCLDDLMENGYEENTSLLSEKLTRSDLLMDVTWKIAGYGDDGQTLYLSVRGDVTECIEGYDEEDET